MVNPNFHNEKITTRQLATHTSSITDNEFYSSKNYYLKSNQNLTGLKMTFEDDQTFNPSDSFIAMKTMAAYIIEQATGQSFKDFTSEHILKPLRMKHSGWKFGDICFSKFSRLYENPQTPLSYYELVNYPDGGLMTNVSDVSIMLTTLIKRSW